MTATRHLPARGARRATVLTLAAAALAAASALATPAAQAQSTAWVDWTAETATTMSGTLMLPDGAVEARFSGPLYFGQTGGPDERDYWWSGGPDAYAATGTPPGLDILAFTGGTGTKKYKLTFSRPVANPVFAFVSLGRYSTPARVTFSAKAKLLSSGVGYYGGCDTCLQASGKTVTGTEGHGVVQLKGTFTTITWQLPDFEEWFGMQVGAPAIAR